MIEQKSLRGRRRNVATWEHIINDASIVSRENIARCCAACNSSKGSKKLSDWIQSGYCKKRGINKDTVEEVVKEALRGCEVPDLGLCSPLFRGIASPLAMGSGRLDPLSGGHT